MSSLKTMNPERRLIEHRLPLKEISEASAREKSIRHGHISTLHIWWARRPLAASRAAVFATLVPDTDENYELVKRIVPWEAVKDGNNPDILEARRRVLEANGGQPPRVLDPFAGGGAIPLEALRLGCETYALDLNPVAYLILKATLEYPQKYGQPESRPVPEYIRQRDREAWSQEKQKPLLSGEGEWVQSYRKNPLATEVRYWGEWVLERARAELAEFYPQDPDGKTPVAYLWARTVTCTNPTCRAEVPLVRQWWLAKKDKKRIALKPLVDERARTISFAVVEVGKGEDWPEKGTIERGNATCLVCSNAIPNDAIRQQGVEGRMGQRLLAVVLSAGQDGKTYRLATPSDSEVFDSATKRLKVVLEDLKKYFLIGDLSLSPLPEEPINVADKRNFWVGEYGPSTWGQLFNPRQALALVTFAKWVREAHAEMLRRGIEEEWARGVATYLALTLDKTVDYNSSICTWANHGEYIGHTFVRQALPMVWDYAETVPITETSGNWEGALDWNIRVVEQCSLIACQGGTIHRATATQLPFPDGFFDAIITDPPYYDAVPYADLSDFFYVWLKRTVGHLYPEHFRTPLTPKSQEAVQNPVRHGGDNQKAKQFFEDMMRQAFQEMHRVLKPGGEATIVFAHKSTEAWETLISALIQAGFRVEASWPLHTEMQTRLRARESAALASSTFLNCTKRSGGGVGFFADVRREMQEAIRPRLQEFWEAGIRGADFFMSAIGPGLEAYSRYDLVKRADGRQVGVGEFLDEVRRIVLEFALEQVLGAKAVGGVDGPTQFALLALWAYGTELPSDEARKLAQSVGVELSGLGSLVQQKGEKTQVRLSAERAKDKRLGRPAEGAASGQERVPMIDALHRTLLLRREGKQAIADYLEEVGYLESEVFWQVAQALAEVLEGTEESRALKELLAVRQGLPKPGRSRLF
jgi:putative DNA methylase